MNERILIVDDEANILVPLKFLLERNRYSVSLAQSGREAFDSIARQKPALILLDIMLPDMDGHEICQKLRCNREWDDIKVVFLTAKNRDVDIAKGIHLGADAYISKPFSNADLLATIRSLTAENMPGEIS